MRIAQQESLDYLGTITVLNHCTFKWRQRNSGAGHRFVAVEPEHCPLCVGLLQRFGPPDGLVVDGPNADEPVLHDPNRPFVRDLKEQAADAVEKRRYRRAAELYQTIALHEPNDPNWPLRAGEVLRSAGESVAAADQLAIAAAGFAWAHAFAKAAAASKVAVLLDPRHPWAAALMARLAMAQREPSDPRIPLVYRDRVALR